MFFEVLIFNGWTLVTAQISAITGKQALNWNKISIELAYLTYGNV